MYPGAHWEHVELSEQATQFGIGAPHATQLSALDRKDPLLQARHSNDVCEHRLQLRSAEEHAWQLVPETKTCPALQELHS